MQASEAAVIAPRAVQAEISATEAAVAAKAKVRKPRLSAGLRGSQLHSIGYRAKPRSCMQFS
jgi:hypothetical protein